MKLHGEENKGQRLSFVLVILALLIFVSGPGTAQESSGQFGGGSVKIGYDSRTCDSTLAGSLRYNSGGGGGATSCVEYCDGSAWTCPSDGGSPPSGCATIGDVCSDGSVFAGHSPDGNVKMYTTPADAGLFSWNNGSTNFIDTAMDNNSYVTGEANTALLVGLSDSASPYDAAVYCYNLTAHGQTDWYLPARSELDILYDNHAAIGGFDTSGDLPGSFYWSSSEYHTILAWFQIFDSGGQNGTDKNREVSVRCVRKD